MSALRQDLHFMLEAIPGRALEASAMGGPPLNDAGSFTLAVCDGVSTINIAMSGEVAYSIAKGIMNSLARGGLDLSSAPSEAGGFLPMGMPNG